MVCDSFHPSVATSPAAANRPTDLIFWLKTIATIVTEHAQLSDSSSLFSPSVLLSLRVLY